MLKKTGVFQIKVIRCTLIGKWPMNIDRGYNYLYFGRFRKFMSISLHQVIRTSQNYHSRTHPEERKRNDKWNHLKPLVLPIFPFILFYFFVLVSWTEVGYCWPSKWGKARYQNNFQTLPLLGRTVSPRPTIISLYTGYIYSIEVFIFRIYQQVWLLRISPSSQFFYFQPQKELSHKLRNTLCWKLMACLLLKAIECGLWIKRKKNSPLLAGKAKNWNPDKIFVTAVGKPLSLNSRRCVR